MVLHPTSMDANITVTLRDPKIVAVSSDNLSREQRILYFKTALAYQPVVIVLKSGCKLFSSYSGGILTRDDDCACEQVTCIDHAVVLVGFNDTDPIPYWKVRNSWSTRWGEDGYVRIAQAGGGRWGLFGMLVCNDCLICMNVCLLYHSHSLSHPRPKVSFPWTLTTSRRRSATWISKTIPRSKRRVSFSFLSLPAFSCAWVAFVCGICVGAASRSKKTVFGLHDLRSL